MIRLSVVAEKGWANEEVEFAGENALVDSLVAEREDVLRWMRGMYPEL